MKPRLLIASLVLALTWMTLAPLAHAQSAQGALSTAGAALDARNDAQDAATMILRADLSVTTMHANEALAKANDFQAQATALEQRITSIEAYFTPEPPPPPPPPVSRPVSAWWRGFASHEVTPPASSEPAYATAMDAFCASGRINLLWTAFALSRDQDGNHQNDFVQPPRNTTLLAWKNTIMVSASGSVPILNAAERSQISALELRGVLARLRVGNTTSGALVRVRGFIGAGQSDLGVLNLAVPEVVDLLSGAYARTVQTWGPDVGGGMLDNLTAYPSNSGNLFDPTYTIPNETLWAGGAAVFASRAQAAIAARYGAGPHLLLNVGRGLLQAPEGRAWAIGLSGESILMVEHIGSATSSTGTYVIDTCRACDNPLAFVDATIPASRWGTMAVAEYDVAFALVASAGRLDTRGEPIPCWLALRPADGTPAGEARDLSAAYDEMDALTARIAALGTYLGPATGLPSNQRGIITERGRLIVDTASQTAVWP